MPLFAVIAHDVPNSIEKRLAVRPRHVARLEKLHAEGRIIVAGPLPTSHDTPPTGFSGSLFVLDFPDRASMDAWFAEEPFVLEGIYASIEVKPFLQTFLKQS